MAAILFSGLIGPVPVSVIVRESHQSNLGITELPIETGAKVTDHAYVEPKRISLEFADASAAATFNALVRFQESRVPFTFVSGLFVYNSMLIKSLSADRDATFSTVLAGKAELQEVIIVSTAYTSSEGDVDSAGSNKATEGKSKPGGEKSTRAARPSTERAGDAVTGDRAAATSMRGDAATRSVPTNENASILSRMF